MFDRAAAALVAVLRAESVPDRILDQVGDVLAHLREAIAQQPAGGLRRSA